MMSPGLQAEVQEDQYENREGIGECLEWKSLKRQRTCRDGPEKNTFGTAGSGSSNCAKPSSPRP
jgi:hypothetical protein